MKRYILILVCALCTCAVNAQIRYLQLNKYNNSATLNIPVDAIDSISFGYQTVWYIDFTHKLVSESIYDDPTFYHVGAAIEFRPNIEVTPSFGDCRWNFGDGTPEQIGDIMRHQYTTAGDYTVTLTTDKVKAQHTIHISELYPLINVIYDGEVATKDSDVSFEVIVPNPWNQAIEYQWVFPEGTSTAAGETITNFNGSAEALGKVRFSTVGSNYVYLQVLLDGRAIDPATIVVNIAEDIAAPTLYYAVKGGNIMALKLTTDLPTQVQQGMKPYDLGVSSGKHALNLLFEGETLFLLDAGEKFTYQDDVWGNLGDGKILAIAKDGSKVEIVLSNEGGPAFQDPFYGYIENGNLYYSDRSTGIVTVPLETRNAHYSASQFPYFVENNRLGYYGKGLMYGAITSCFGKVEDTYYWGKTYNGLGFWRFKVYDILAQPVTDADPIPTSGGVLNAFYTKTFVYNKNTQDFFFVLYGNGEGIYKCKVADLDAINHVKDLPASITFAADQGTAAGKGIIQITTYGVGEGSSGEYLGVTQLALDEATGNIYFGLRSNETDIPSGLVMYNAATNQLEYILKGVEIYGVTINPTPTKLF